MRPCPRPAHEAGPGIKAKLKVKICGIMQPEDAVVATEAGADFVGMIFVPQRHRLLDVQTGSQIAQAVRAASPPDQAPKIVGNFADQPLEEVNRIIKDCGLDTVQLCGKESLEYCGRVNAGVIKVVHVDTLASGAAHVDRVTERVQAYTEAGHLVTLDRLVVGIQGGTGHTFDWSIATQLSQRGLPLILAGGLSPENVAQAIVEVQPWGVDVSSGVETNGVKDHDKIQAFIRNAR